MEITGLLRIKKDTEQVSDKFKKREFVITDNSSQYPQHISFQLTQDKCELISQYPVGSEIKVHFNLRGREWVNPQGEPKYFNSLEAWRIESVKNLQVDRGEDMSASTHNDSVNPDDLPF
jgi:hypothetical protein